VWAYQKTVGTGKRKKSGRKLVIKMVKLSRRKRRDAEEGRREGKLKKKREGYLASPPACRRGGRRKNGIAIKQQLQTPLNTKSQGIIIGG